jgi:hypothetical protein
MVCESRREGESEGAHREGAEGHRQEGCEGTVVEVGEEADNLIIGTDMPVFRWIVDSSGSSLTSLSDEFLVQDCRMRFFGFSLEVEVPEGGTEKEARRLADRYTDLLRSGGLLVRLFTSEEYSTLPPYPVYAIGPDPMGQMLAVSAVRRAREALLAGSDEILRRCYEYRDQMLDDEEHALFHAYKLMEILEGEFGEEDRGIRVKIRYVKRAASDPQMDERHAPKAQSETPAEPPCDRATALQYTHDILRAYEQHRRP